MAVTISSSSIQGIDALYPVAGVDNDSQGFRDNFNIIKTQLGNAATDLSALDTNTAKLNANNDFSGNDISDANFIKNTEEVNNIGGIFTSQNIVYNNLFNIKNRFLRGGAAGIITTPVYTYLETSKINSRINQLPNYNIFMCLILIRQAIFYSVLYQVSVFNIPNATFIAALVANLIGFPIKILTLIKSYSGFVVNKKTIIISAIIEIFKASISDGSSLFLMYTPSFSPLKKIY